MPNPYQPPQSSGVQGPGTKALLKRILAVPLVGISLISGALALLSLMGTALNIVQGLEFARAVSGVGTLVFLVLISVASFALARAWWDPAQYSRAAIDQRDLRALYKRERLAELDAGDVGIYAETEDGELVRLHQRVRPDRLPQRHRELMARIKQRVEELGPADE
jgi:hypothetical protein